MLVCSFGLPSIYTAVVCGIKCQVTISNWMSVLNSSIFVRMTMEALNYGSLHNILMGEAVKPCTKSTSNLYDSVLKTMNWSPILGGSKVMLQGVGCSNTSLNHPSGYLGLKPYKQDKTMFLSHGALNFHCPGMPKQCFCFAF